MGNTQQTSERPGWLVVIGRKSGLVRFLLCVAVLFAPSSAQAIFGWNGSETAPIFSLINEAVGATRFYNGGFYGNDAFIANVEGGYVWSGHEALRNSLISYVENPATPFAAANRQYDWHATAVGFTMVGLGYYDSQVGIAPYAGLASTAIATSFGPRFGEFEISTESLVHGYRSVMESGVTRNIGFGTIGPVRVDVVNSSWGGYDPSGSAQETMIIDALAYANHQTVCLAAGNDGAGAAVGGPASGFNKISVGALSGVATNPAYGQLAEFSSTGPNDFYNPALSRITRGVRPAVDIAAPGTDLFLAAYLGFTGSDAGTYLGLDSVTAQRADLYFRGLDGTSFASPIVAGGAALVVDAGKTRFPTNVNATDGRVVKAILLNSATKISGWNNNPSLASHVYSTSQGLDLATGAGALNLDRAYDQFLSGTTDLAGLGGGTVRPIGWDFGNVSDVASNTYFIDTALRDNQVFTATLDWFIRRSFNPADNTASDVAFDYLDLKIWKVDNGVLTRLVAESISRYNNVQHVTFRIPENGFYAIGIEWNGFAYDMAGNTVHNNDYALAWSVATIPLPTTFLGGAGLFVGIIAMRIWRRGSVDQVV